MEKETQPRSPETPFHLTNAGCLTVWLVSASVMCLTQLVVNYLASRQPVP